MNKTQTKTNEVYIPTLKVLGLGGAGCNAINRMVEYGYQGVEYIAANTDAQALKTNADKELLIGGKLTRGLGAGGDPRIGYQAALESRNEIEAALAGADVVFLTAGMGGGTGTGSIIVAAEAAKSIGATVIAIVTTPFKFEAGVRQKNAKWGIEKLQTVANTLITIPNDRILTMAPADLPIDMAFQLADDVLRQAVQGLSELITEDGIINVDFAHVQHLLHQGGGAFMTIGQGSGENRTLKAIQQATTHPLLENISLSEASGLIISMKGGDDFSLYEVSEALSELNQQMHPEVELIWGVTNEPHLIDTVQVIMVMTGIGATKQQDIIAKMDIKQPKPKQEKMPQQRPQEIEIADTVVPPYLSKRAGSYVDSALEYEVTQVAKRMEEVPDFELEFPEPVGHLVAPVLPKKKTIYHQIDLDRPAYLRVKLDGEEFQKK